MRRLVIGVGAPLGDDAVGLHVARRLAQTPLPDDVRVLARERPGLDLALELRGAEAAVIVDALRPQGTPGRVRRLRREELAHVAPTSSHGLGVAEALALGEALGILPPRIALVGVETAGLRGEALSPAVADAVEQACDAVRELLAEDAPGALLRAEGGDRA